MKFTQLFVSSILIAFVILAASEAPQKEGDVYVLTKSSFDDFINENELALVEFYAPWCGHCKTLAPQYAAAATQLLKSDPPIKLAKVDCTVETELQSRFGVSGYPTLKIFRKGTPSEYSGPRETQGIVSFMEKQSGPSAKPVNTLDQLIKLRDSTDLLVVGFFASKTSAVAQAFYNTADSLRDHFKFAAIEDPSVAEEQKLAEGITLLKTFDQKEVAYGGSNSVGSLSEWIWEQSVPSVGELHKGNQERYKRRGLPIFKLFIDVAQKGANQKKTNYYLNRLRKVSQEPSVADRLSFAVLDRKAYSNEMTPFGLDSKNEASVAIDDAKGSLKYKYDGPFDVQKLTDFAKDWAAGKLEPWIKSEPVPESQGDVTVVVGKTFNEIVLDDTKDVLLEVYAPWCGHCKKLEPIYNELATKLKDNKNLVIAKLDATANDVPHPKYQAKGYPTIFFSPAGKKESPLPYNGERTVDGFEKYLRANAKSFSAKDEL